ncbi:CYFA0S02e09428g1_1 [Cyberlindnera fabianii]|uniref:CYFA0S02e09428g1_1 n=1 Tax=Cyberlindnera fabianii TaxID=36022 RepID=A0A061AUF8_CYBFA|nr:CYFA0S02e09428g1_1 [Cyberlindnera fabianii]
MGVQREVTVSDDHSTTALQYLGITLGVLFFIRLILPFITLLTLITLVFFALLAAGSVIIRLPKQDDKNLRTQFPRFAFTRSDDWDREAEIIKLNDTFDEPEWSTDFNRSTDTIVRYVLRDFVLTWFRSISQSDGFPNELRLQLRHAFLQLENRAKDIDVSKLLIIDIVPLITKHLTNVSTADETVVGEKNISGSAELELKVAKEYDHISKVHQFISLKSADSEKDKKAYARDRVSKIIEYILPKNELDSAPLQVLVRELMSNIVLFPLLRLLSDPDFWNQVIVKFSAATLKDRDQVRELRNAIEEQYNNPNSKILKAEPHGPLFDSKITPQMKQPEFQKYIKNIDTSKSALSLKQLKYYIAVQISRTHRINSKSDRFLKYTKRLNIAKDRIDKRIILLSSSTANSHERQESPSVLDRDVGSFISSLTLTQILGNPSSLSFFMEFMEQRSRTILLQYWLTVQGIKDPLEDPHNPDYEEELSSSTELGDADDIKLIFSTFFDKDIMKISKRTYQEVKEFTQGTERSIEKYLRVRKLILMLQIEVFKRMEDRDLPDFKSSDLFLKLLASETFEQSLINEVDDLHEHGLGGEDDDGESDMPVIGEADDSMDGSFFELENALTDILNKDHSGSVLPSEPSSEALSKKSADALKTDLFGSEEDGFLDQKPLFDDRDDIDDEDGIDDLEGGDIDADPNFFQVSHDVLNSKEGIAQLNQDIEKLTKQSEMLDPLILKAELTNNSNELRLLKKSKTSYQREIESKELLRQQLIVQENENSLYGKTNVAIDSWIKARSRGRDYIVYLIEIEKAPSQDDGASTTWMVGRRFNQFYKLNEILREQCPEVDTISFPKKKLVLKFQQKSLIDERRAQLQRYIQQLLEMPTVCQNKEFRKFLTAEEYKAPSSGLLSQSTELKGAAKNLYNGIYSGIDILSSKTSSVKTNDEIDDTLSEQGGQAEDMRKELENYESERATSKSFVKPITDLFIALFPLNSTNSWLRGRAIIVVLQQVLGSTIEKYIKGQVSGFASEAKMIEVVSMLQGILWPDGHFMKSGVPRTTPEKMKCKREARLLLEALMMDTLPKFVGQSGAKNASSRLYCMLQNEILNTNLVYEILDIVLEALFPGSIQGN